MNTVHDTPPRPTLDTLYPHLSPEEQAEAAYRLRRYLAIVRRIYERKAGIDRSSRKG